MEALTKKIFAVIFYAIISVFMTALFIVTLTQGIMIQISTGESILAFIHYSSALLSLVAAYLIYLRTKKITGILSGQ